MGNHKYVICMILTAFISKTMKLNSLSAKSSEVL